MASFMAFKEGSFGSSSLSGSGLLHANWLNLINPEPGLLDKPPWVILPGIEKLGLLDRGLKPKEHVESWLTELKTAKPKQGRGEFIDISPEEIYIDAQMRFSRVWAHFMEMIG